MIEAEIRGCRYMKICGQMDSEKWESDVGCEAEREHEGSVALNFIPNTSRRPFLRYRLSLRPRL